MIETKVTKKKKKKEENQSSGGHESSSFQISHTPFHASFEVNRVAIGMVIATPKIRDFSPRRSATVVHCRATQFSSRLIKSLFSFSLSLFPSFFLSLHVRLDRNRAGTGPLNARYALFSNR